MKPNKKKFISFGVVLLIIAGIVSFIAVSFSYLNPIYNIGTTYSTKGLSQSDVIITYKDCADTSAGDCSLISEDLIPGESITKTFQIKNTGTISGSISLYFAKLYNTFTDQAGTGSELSYNIVELDTSGNVLEENDSPKYLVSQRQLPYTGSTLIKEQKIDDITLAAGQTRVFKITISFASYSYSQNYNSDAEYLIKFGVGDANSQFTQVVVTAYDSSGASTPKIENTGLIPVIYDEENETWIKTSTANWYNYDEQIWANAVAIDTTKLSDYADLDVGDAIDLDDIVGMYVWIPRFEYKISGTYGSGGNTTAALPGMIDINFIGTSETVTSGYTIHPAFTDGSQNSYVYGGWDEEITGFWYGKFEASGTYNSSSYTSSTIKVIPATSDSAISSLRSLNTYNQFMAAKSVSTYQGFGSTLDSHMSKNDEWGAVAYLSQSTYGKYGNTNYTGANKQVYINNYNKFYTGVSSGAPSAATSETVVCYYNDIEDRGDGLGSCGGGASTTGNIYGVYDMNGGAWEYTMSYLESTNGKAFDDEDNTTPYQYGNIWGATSSANYSGWTNSLYSTNLQGINHKYYNAYTTTVAATACGGGKCYGHALSETAGWYGDYQSMINASYPWFGRGGHFYGGSNAGVFNFYISSGSAYSSSGFRVVLT